jgi:Methyltransferase domain
MRPELDPDEGWIEVLSGAGTEASRRALLEAQSERGLFSHLKGEHEREGRSSYVEIDAPLELHALVRLTRPLHVVEVGVSSGVSSAYLLNALAKNGKGTLHSVDLPSISRRPPPGRKAPHASWSLPPGRSPGWAIPKKLRVGWDLRVGDKAAMLPILARQLPRVDLLVYDVPHSDRTTWEEFELLDPLLPPGGVAIVDHGPGGGLCAALRTWGRVRRASPVRRRDLGLYGMRVPPRFRTGRAAKPSSVPRAATGKR